MLSCDDLKRLVELATDEPISGFDPSANMYENYGLDSMGAIALIVEIQRLTGIRIPEAAAELIRSGDDINRYLASVRR